MLSVALLSLSGLALGLNQASVGCGNINEKCCAQKDIPKDDRYYYDYLGDDFCWSTHDTLCVEGKCKAISQLPCGGVDEPCCDPSKYDSDYLGLCTGGLFCVDDTCQGKHALPCGMRDERCCTAADVENGGYPYSYYGYNESFCFGSSSCVDNTCVTCNREGDTCCYDRDYDQNYCQGSNMCVKDACVACGGPGEPCCDVDTQSHWYYDMDTCQEGLGCFEGVCEHCGYENSPCCGEGDNAYCRLEDMVCNAESSKCESCGGIDEVCCGGESCGEPWLECSGGQCVCGGDGELCCEGICREGMTCNQDSQRCAR